MPLKKNKSKEKISKPTKKNQYKFILLRDTDTKIESIVDYSSVSNSKNTRIEVGIEVIYTKTDQSRGHGTILIIGWCFFNNVMILLFIFHE